MCKQTSHGRKSPNNSCTLKQTYVHMLLSCLFLSLAILNNGKGGPEEGCQMVKTHQANFCLLRPRPIHSRFFFLKFFKKVKKSNNRDRTNTENKNNLAPRHYTSGYGCKTLSSKSDSVSSNFTCKKFYFCTKMEVTYNLPTISEKELQLMSINFHVNNKLNLRSI